MVAGSRESLWLPNFRRTLAYLRRRLRPLCLGLAAAVGVSVFYTFSVSSLAPLLKVIFSDRETLAGWLHRAETQRRLGVQIGADLPDDPQGLTLIHVNPESMGGQTLRPGDRITSIDGHRQSSHELMHYLAGCQSETVNATVVRPTEADEQEIHLELKPYRAWTGTMIQLAGRLPSDKDSESRMRTLGIVMGLLVLLTLLGGLCRLANEWLVATAVQGALHDLRSDLAEHILRLPMRWHGSQPPGDTLGRFATDINKLETGLTMLFENAVREPLKAVGVLAIALWIDWRMLIVAMIGVPVGLAVMAVFGRLVKYAQKRASESWGRLLDRLEEKILGIRIVKAYDMQAAEGVRFEREGRAIAKAQTRIELIDAITKPALEVLAVLGLTAFVLYGATRVFNQQLEPHLFFAAIICLGGVFDPIRKLGKVNNRLQAAEASARRLLELLDLPGEDSERPSREERELAPLSRLIEFRHVSFAYPSHPEKPVLDDFNLKVRKGQVVALVGPNGSGKTTLISLLLRFFEPISGEILIDDVSIAGASLTSLRRQIGLVTQDAVVFSDSIRANIAYGADGSIDERKVRRAAELAHVDDFIQTLVVRENGRETAGYDAFVTARMLSGGQRQRLALARAIYRDPPILILDEATSQVDSESERKIQAAIEDVSRDRTTFIIAHRYSTIAHADVTVVLNEGRLVAYGRHAELMESCPFYVNLCRTQFAHAV